MQRWNDGGRFLGLLRGHTLPKKSVVGTHQTHTKKGTEGGQEKKTHTVRPNVKAPRLREVGPFSKCPVSLSVSVSVSH